jgi:hypothetical protein
MCLGKFHLLRNLFRQQIVIRIQILQPFSSCEFQQTVPCCVTAAVRAGLPADMAAKTFDDLETAIS